MKAKGVNFANFSQINICNTQVSNKVKFIYSEKATKFCEISTVDLSHVVTFKSLLEILQNFVVFSEYINFNDPQFWNGFSQCLSAQSACFVRIESQATFFFSNKEHQSQIFSELAFCPFSRTVKLFFSTSKKVMLLFVLNIYSFFRLNFSKLNIQKTNLLSNDLFWKNR